MLQWNFKPAWRVFVITTLACALFPAQSSAPPPIHKPVGLPAGVQIVSNGGESELRVDGVPYFIHAAQFDYFRIPPRLWFRSLDRYRELGINTIDLRIPWNWHEISDGEFDFDGHTNLRRNLRDLLQLIAEKHLKLIARPGPLIGDHWRNAGYPAWLLGYSDYKMNQSAIEAGSAPPDGELIARDGNAAAKDWLANQTHMTYTRRWLTAIAKELAPYSSRNNVQITESGEREGETQQEEISGPLLFVALDDAVAIPGGSTSTDLSRYVSELRGALSRGGLNVDSFMNVPMIGARGAPSLSNDLVTEDRNKIGLTAEWLYHPATEQNPTSIKKTFSSEIGDKSRLTTLDGTNLLFLASSLKTQPNFPPLLSGFATTTFTPAGDIRAIQPPPENLLLASRLLLGSGVRGITYSPLQDTLTPAGWGTQAAARYFRWDAALDLAGNNGTRAGSVMRNGQFISTWGAMLASSHPRADFGIVDLRTCLAEALADQSVTSRIARTIEQIFRVSRSAGFTPELLNPAAQPVERLLRAPVILFPVPEGNAGIFVLSEKAQRALVEFVRRGGVLIYFPYRPEGTLLEPLWQGAPTASATREGMIEWPFERGRVIAYSSDFYSWVSLGENLEQNQAQPESSRAAESLTALLKRAGTLQSLRRDASGKVDTGVFITQLISNEAPVTSARRHACAEEQLCADALVSVSNLSADQSAQESFEITDTRESAVGSRPATVSFNVTVPAHESLMLPVHASLCSVSVDEHCTDEVISSGAELLGAEREGKTLKLVFYAPARATVRLHLESQPTKVELAPDFRLETQWKQETGELEFSMLRGAAPGYLRVLLIHLRYTPHVNEKSEHKKNNRQVSESEVFDALRLPLAPDASIPSGPPLILTGSGGGQMTIASWNRSDNMHALDFTLEGAFHGTGSGRVFPGEQLFTRLRFQPTRNSTTADGSGIATADGLLHGEITLRSGHERGSVPVLFVPVDEAGNAHYQYDFDGDGAAEWILESKQLRLIVSPEDAGRALAVVDKSTNANLIALGGALHDFLVPKTSAQALVTSSGDFAANRAYRAAWMEEKQGTALQLAYDERQNSSAGLHVEKILRLTAAETIEAIYHISSGAAAPSVAENDSAPGQNFISVMTVPVSALDEESTHFCWRSTGSSAPHAITTGAAKSASDMHCENFIASAEPILIPPEIMQLEIQTPGHRAFTIDWTSAHAVILPKNFSAQVQFAIAAPPAGAAPAEFTLRYTVGGLGP